MCAVDAVAISEEEAWHVSPRECLDDLSGSPLGGWIVCDVEMKDPSPIVRKNQEDKENLEPDSGDTDR